MHDINLIRTRPEYFEQAMKRRGLEVDVDQILDLDKAIRRCRTDIQTAQTEQRRGADEIGKLVRARDMDGVAGLKAAMKDHKESERTLGIELADREADLRDVLLGLPNILADTVPDGQDERDNVVLKTWGLALPQGEFSPHYDIPVGIDFEAGVKLSGSRFTVLHGEVAKLHRKLGQLMLDHAVEQGFHEYCVPTIVNSDAMVGTGQLPKFADDAYAVGDQWLIPTAEVSLTNLVADQIFDHVAPIRMTALSQCYRREAGSAGRDTRGLLRQHQFEKVELVTVCRPDDAEVEHERITATAEGVLEKLDLRYRRVALCSGDTGFSARKTYDLEVWMAGTREWREISSCSDMGDFQARRMSARYRPQVGAKPQYLNTLNGSGLAVGRTLAAVLEQYWDGEKIDLPLCLRSAV